MELKPLKTVRSYVNRASTILTVKSKRRGRREKAVRSRYSSHNRKLGRTLLAYQGQVLARRAIDHVHRDLRMMSLIIR